VDVADPNVAVYLARQPPAGAGREVRNVAVSCEPAGPREVRNVAERSTLEINRLHLYLRSLLVYLKSK
jgi:hypothetical protein